MKVYIRSLINQFIPIPCLLCGISTTFDCRICVSCQKNLPAFKSTCHSCGLPVPSLDVHRCGQCLAKPSPISRTVCGFSYQFPVDKLIVQFKYHQQLGIGETLSHLLAFKIKQLYQGDSLPEQLIPVPMFPKRLASRGFNQAEIISKQLSKYLNIPVNNQSCKRVIDTKPQEGLNARQRQKNLQNAFKRINHVPPHVAIVDDVITTGATISALVETLSATDVTRIDVWSLARTPAN
ncbi:ComF family protein [Zooshikella marina]|uniref:ComF family protein n=1 Tax=Zooshikella ganghwensis TaxID=202772 RepID=UPI001C04D30D|nr:ComF family protein [Zooshikella ganghwensis]MBU2706418.1 ComF family protein [Zooshikella ganghwensis]